MTAKVVRALLAAEERAIPAAGSPASERSLDDLTPRELEVVECILKGKSNKTISQELFLTEGTVKNYVSRILEKLELKNRSELIVRLHSHSRFAK